MKLNDKWLKKKWVSYTIATCSAVVLMMILTVSTAVLAEGESGDAGFSLNGGDGKKMECGDPA